MSDYIHQQHMSSCNLNSFFVKYYLPYHEVLITIEKGALQCILWRSSPFARFQTYTLNTVTYGTAAAPSLAIRSLTEFGNLCDSSEPLISTIIKTDLYVDDLLTGTSNKYQVKYTVKTLNNVLSSGCFKFGKWLANCPEILKGINVNNLHPTFLELGKN